MNGQGRLARLLAPQILRPAAAIAMFAVFGLALWVIHYETRTMSFEDIRAAIGNVGMIDVAAGCGLTALSFLMLIGFDALALRSSGIRVPFPRIAFAAFCAQAISHTAGFAALTGTSVRLRVYGNAGVPPAAVAKLMVFCATAFTLGAVTLGGLAGLFEGTRVAAALNLPETVVHLTGILALAVFLIYATASARGAGIHVRSWRIAVPALPVTIGQTLLAIGDLIAAGAVLWVLLPADLPLSFPAFLGLYVVAIVAGVLAHVPAGLGVFEGIVLLFLPGVPAPEVLGALVVYRFVYNLVPLILAATLIALAEAGRAAGRMAPAIRRAGAGAAQIAPIAFALLAIASGAVLLASAATPAATGRLDLLDGLPLVVVEASHLASGVVGLLLLVIARGLARRVDAAWMAATILSGLGAVLSLLKGWDWEEAILLAVVTGLLVLARRAFGRGDDDHGAHGARQPDARARHDQRRPPGVRPRHLPLQVAGDALPAPGAGELAQAVRRAGVRHDARAGRAGLPERAGGAGGRLHRGHAAGRALHQHHGRLHVRPADGLAGRLRRRVRAAGGGAAVLGEEERGAGGGGRGGELHLAGHDRQEGKIFA